MKKPLILSLILSGIILAPVALAVTDAQMRACYQAHAQLMQKPALRNLVSCWREHGYLMQRQ